MAKRKKRKGSKKAKRALARCPVTASGKMLKSRCRKINMGKKRRKK